MDFGYFFSCFFFRCDDPNPGISISKKPSFFFLYFLNSKKNSLTPIEPFKNMYIFFPLQNK